MKNSNQHALIYLMTLGLVSIATLSASAQTSSLGARQRKVEKKEPPKVLPREAPRPKPNATYLKYSWLAIQPPPPKTFEVHDLVTIIVQQRRQYEADAEMQAEKDWNIRTQLEEFFKPTAGGLGAATFRRGMPNIDFSFENETDAKADAKRDDKLTTRITGTIIDVKPNGNLVLQARGRLQHDDEISVITVTGECRKDDVTADNAILSTQIADLNIEVTNEGVLRRSTRRGWIPELLDWLRPF